MTVAVHVTVTVLHGFSLACAVALAVGYIVHFRNKKRHSMLKERYTQWWPNHKEHWRWIKDDSSARMMAYYFPSLVSKIPSGLVRKIPFGYFFADCR